MIDLHSHLIPVLDDGSRSLDQSLHVLGLFAQDGVEAVVLTPHVTASDMERAADGAVSARDEAYAPLAAAGLVAPRLHLGFEIMLDQPLTRALAEDPRFALAGSRYLLVEFPYAVAPESAAQVLAQIADWGRVPIVAHPERYDACSPTTVEQWRDAGARIQVDANTLLRPTDRGHRVRALISAGLADVLAADNHGNRRRLLGNGRRYLEARGGTDEARLLTVINPRAVVEDREMEEVPGVALKEGVLDRWRRFIKG